MVNRYYLNEQLFPRTGNCVFISHQRNDKSVAKEIANYIYKSGVDIYFDEYDRSINRDDPQSVVNAIKTGIRNSTHMLCILSQNALQSKWMPWEIGGRDYCKRDFKICFTGVFADRTSHSWHKVS